MSVFLLRRKDGSLKSPYYQYDFVLKIDGQSYRFYGSTRTTTEAEANLYEATEKKNAVAKGPLDDMTLNAACFRYCSEVGPNITSIDDLEKSFEHCCRLIGGGKRLIKLTSDEIANAVRKRAAETYGKQNQRLVSNATVNRQIVEPLKRLLRRARTVWKIRKIDLADFPWKEMKLREAPARVRELTTEEGAAFWSYIANHRPDYLPFVWFLGARGFRVRSALGMKKFDVDLSRKVAKVWKKGVGMVPVKLTSQQCDVIRIEMKKAPEIKEIWTFEKLYGEKKGTRRAITYNGLRRMINSAIKATGIEDLRIHDLRHDFATKLLRSSGNLALVQKSLGHADVESTVRYAHVLDDEVVAAMDVMPVPEIPQIGAKPKKMRKA